MFTSSYRIARVWGIPIKLDISLIALLVMLSFNFGLWGGLAMAVGLLTSIVLHELGHSIVAIHKGCRVREITLMFMGGAAQMERIPTRPLDEFLMALAGPAVSFLLGGLCLWGGSYVPLRILRHFVGDLNIVQWIGVVNWGLVVFNLLPAFPMDGGRILRSALTPKFGRLRATAIAARLGKIMAVLFGIFGLTQENWILVVIAFFVFISAGNEYRMVEMQEADRRHGFGGWSSFGGGSRSESDDDRVVISPPPYDDGPDTETDIRQDDEQDPFRNIFRR